MRVFIIISLTFIYTITLAQNCSCSTGGCDITSTISYNGSFATGNYSVFLASGHTTIQNPLIYIEGIDINNTIDCNIINNNFALDQISNQGYDIIFLNLDDNLDYIQKNAFLLIELLNIINSSYNNGCVVFGDNTGAIIARYALTYMEENGFNHNTKLYISYDGPHQGLNIPVSLRLHLNHYNNPPVNLFAAELLTVFNRPLFNQLQINGNDYKDGANNSDAFFNDLILMNNCNGYPKLCRKIAISRGSGYGENQKDINDNIASDGTVMFFYSHSEQVGSVSGHCSVVPTIPPATSNTYFGIEHLSWLANQSASSIDSANIYNQKPYGICPGTYNTEIVNLISNLSTTIGVLSSEIDYFFVKPTFIPTISALDINTNNLMLNLSTTPNILESTPFDDIRYQNSNKRFTDNWPLYFSMPFILNNLSLAEDYAMCDDDYIIKSSTISANENVNLHSKIKTVITSIIESNSTTLLKSEGDIIMKPNFNASQGSNFIAKIKKCEIQLCNPLPVNKKMNKSEIKVIEKNKNSDSEKKVIVFPNPIKNDFFIESSFNIMSVCIFNQIGSLIYISFPNKKSCHMVINELPKGTYLLKVSGEKMVQHKKIIKL